MCPGNTLPLGHFPTCFWPLISLFFHFQLALWAGLFIQGIQSLYSWWSTGSDLSSPPLLLSLGQKCSNALVLFLQYRLIISVFLSFRCFSLVECPEGALMFSLILFVCSVSAVCCSYLRFPFTYSMLSGNKNIFSCTLSNCCWNFIKRCLCWLDQDYFSFLYLYGTNTQAWFSISDVSFCNSGIK